MTKIKKRMVYVCVASSQGMRKILWISLQLKGHVSVGFFDNGLSVPMMMTGEGEILRLLEEHGEEHVRRPYFTLHSANPSAAHCHLKSNTNRVLCEVLIVIAPRTDKPVVPWLRFISRPIGELDIYSNASHGTSPEFMCFASADNEELSMEVHIDFAKNGNGDTAVNATFFEWQGVSYRVIGKRVPGQKSALGYQN